MGPPLVEYVGADEPPAYTKLRRCKSEDIVKCGAWHGSEQDNEVVRTFKV